MAKNKHTQRLIDTYTADWCFCFASVCEEITVPHTGKILPFITRIHCAVCAVVVVVPVVFVFEYSYGIYMIGVALFGGWHNQSPVGQPVLYILRIIVFINKSLII